MKNRGLILRILKHVHVHFSQVADYSWLLWGKAQIGFASKKSPKRLNGPNKLMHKPYVIMWDSSDVMASGMSGLMAAISDVHTQRSFVRNCSAAQAFLKLCCLSLSLQWELWCYFSLVYCVAFNNGRQGGIEEVCRHCIRSHSSGWDSRSFLQKSSSGGKCFFVCAGFSLQRCLIMLWFSR